MREVIEMSAFFCVADRSIRDFIKHITEHFSLAPNVRFAVAKPKYDSSRVRLKHTVALDVINAHSTFTVRGCRLPITCICETVIYTISSKSRESVL